MRSVTLPSREVNLKALPTVVNDLVQPEARRRRQRGSAPTSNQFFSSESPVREPAFQTRRQTRDPTAIEIERLARPMSIFRRSCSCRGCR